MTQETWEVEWNKRRHDLQKLAEDPTKPLNLKNPFITAKDNKSASGLWCGRHREGWEILKFIDGKLFECNDDEDITPIKELDAGSTGGRARRFPCYNSENQLGVCIAICIGREAC